MIICWPVYLSVGITPTDSCWMMIIHCYTLMYCLTLAQYCILIKYSALGKHSGAALWGSMHSSTESYWAQYCFKKLLNSWCNTQGKKIVRIWVMYIALHLSFDFSMKTYRTLYIFSYLIFIFQNIGHIDPVIYTHQ